MREAGTVVMAVALAFVLAACDGELSSDPASSGLSASTPTPRPSVTDLLQPSDQSETVRGESVCDGAVTPMLVADSTEPEQLGGVTLAVPIDRGPMPHASGTAVLDDGGVPVAYVVGDNDVLESIGARFCLGATWLHWVNYVRRDGDALFVGDTLNLDAHTILSVGDQDGVVYDNPMPEGFIIPPQR